MFQEPSEERRWVFFFRAGEYLLTFEELSITDKLINGSAESLFSCYYLIDGDRIACNLRNVTTIIFCCFSLAGLNFCKTPLTLTVFILLSRWARAKSMLFRLC